jgi:hypothetical protein
MRVFEIRVLIKHLDPRMREQRQAKDECRVRSFILCSKSPTVNPHLTPWSRILLEKLMGPQLLNKFPSFYETRRFITIFTKARQLSVSSARSIQSMPPHPSSRRSILITLTSS